MENQVDLIGNHPSSPNIFFEWFKCVDQSIKDQNIHRALTEQQVGAKEKAVAWLASKLIEHHYDDARIQRLKDKYISLGYTQYAEQHRKLPRADRTKKGNATEIVLIEYLEACQGKKLVKHFKLRYNPNVDQSIKGDDVLLVDIFKEKKADKVRVFLGEAKFRTKPGKSAVNLLSKSLSTSKKPLSYSFLIDMLSKDAATKALADILDTFVIEEIKAAGNLIYTGCLMSDADVTKVVNKNLKSDNPKLVIISIGLGDPNDLIKRAYEKAEQLISNPVSL